MATEFDKRLLASNITFLMRKEGIRISELEKKLGISAGYLARTLGHDSKKKISIDVVWNIAQLFGIDIKDLLEFKLWLPRSNTELVRLFIKKLWRDTVEKTLNWEYDGGLMYDLDGRYMQLGLVSQKDEETPIKYEFKCHPKYLNPEIKWYLEKDIVCLKSFEGEKDLAIIPFIAEEKLKSRGYEFYFIWQKNRRWQCEELFYTREDPRDDVTADADVLYDAIEEAEFDTKLAAGVRQMLAEYVSEEGSNGKD